MQVAHHLGADEEAALARLVEAELLDVRPHEVAFDGEGLALAAVDDEARGGRAVGQADPAARALRIEALDLPEHVASERPARATGGARGRGLTPCGRARRTRARVPIAQSAAEARNTVRTERGRSGYLYSSAAAGRTNGTMNSRERSASVRAMSTAASEEACVFSAIFLLQPQGSRRATAGPRWCVWSVRPNSVTCERKSRIWSSIVLSLVWRLITTGEFGPCDERRVARSCSSRSFACVREETMPSIDSAVFTGSRLPCSSRNWPEGFPHRQHAFLCLLGHGDARCAWRPRGPGRRCRLSEVLARLDERGPDRLGVLGAERPDLDQHRVRGRRRRRR